MIMLRNIRLIGIALSACLLASACDRSDSRQASRSTAKASSSTLMHSGASSPSQPNASGAPPVASPTGTPDTPDPSQTGQDTPNRPQQALELQELTFTSEVKNKEPVDVLKQASEGTRVWAHLRIRNRNEEPQTLHVQFRVNDSKRTSLDLTVKKSWSYRTWAYNTIQKGDKGKLTFELQDGSGRVLAEQSLPIGPTTISRRYVRNQPK